MGCLKCAEDTIADTSRWTIYENYTFLLLLLNGMGWQDKKFCSIWWRVWNVKCGRSNLAFISYCLHVWRKEWGTSTQYPFPSYTHGTSSMRCSCSEGIMCDSNYGVMLLEIKNRGGDHELEFMLANTLLWKLSFYDAYSRLLESLIVYYKLQLFM